VKPTDDRPPIVRFLVIFGAGLALITALAALADTFGEPGEPVRPAAGSSQS